MKTLIINGSPREKGDTAWLIGRLIAELEGEAAVVSLYKDKISPCDDCRHCHKIKECRIKDTMELIYKDDYDNIVIASPVYMSALTPPVACALSRLQVYYSAKYVLNDPIKLRQKTAVLMLTAGGNGKPAQAMEMARLFFRIINAEYKEENTVLSLNTDKLAAKDDEAASRKIFEIARRLNGGGL